MKNTIFDRIRVFEEIDAALTLIMIDTFLYDCQYGIGKHRKNIRECFGQRNGSALAEAIQFLKGSCINFAAAEVIQLCDLLEMQAREENFDQAAETIRQLEVQLNVMQQEIEEERQKMIS